jgi:hypothetical protein
MTILMTYYIPDASGNVMATYMVDQTTATWQEAHIYGSSRLGVFKPNILLKDPNCGVSFNTTLMHTFGPSDPSFIGEVQNELAASGLADVNSQLTPILRQQLDHAYNMAPTYLEFEAYVNGLADYLCAFNCHTIENDNTFNNDIYISIC